MTTDMVGKLEKVHPPTDMRLSDKEVFRGWWARQVRDGGN
jgi:hypothetical protein